MTRSVLVVLALVAGSFTLLYGTGCEIHDGVVTAGVSTNGYYDYDYYPDSEVYFYPSGNVYYWQDHNNWHHGRDLPRNFDVHNQRHTPLHLNTARPYELHNQTRAQYPGHH